ncbi:porphobilinogen deaminase, dipyromethane cofactor binding domain-containing protein [Dipodascopsis uninucleata]
MHVAYVVENICPHSEDKILNSILQRYKKLTANMSEGKIRLGSRSSKLAVLQTELVIEELKKKFPQYEYEIVTTKSLADNTLDKALYSFGGKPVWTSELEALLVVEDQSKVDVIVHSLKDVPTSLPEQFILGPAIKRADPRDVLCVRSDLPYKSLSELPEGSVVGTSSIRRMAQLRLLYPGLQFKIVRGNIHTRLDKLENEDLGYDCLILAAAGLLRSDLGDRITQYLEPSEYLYAVGQGAIGIEITKTNTKLASMLEAVRDDETTLSCLSERSLLRTLEGGCSLPLGVNSYFAKDGSNKLTLNAIIISVDGTESVSSSITKTIETEEEASELGVLLAKDLLSKGAGPIIEKINYEKIK